MDKIRVGKEDVYTIEVNDKGECIEFDLLDIELPIRCINAGKSIKQENIILILLVFSFIILLRIDNKI